MPLPRPVDSVRPGEQLARLLALAAFGAGVKEFKAQHLRNDPGQWRQDLGFTRKDSQDCARHPQNRPRQGFPILFFPPLFLPVPPPKYSPFPGRPLPLSRLFSESFPLPRPKDLGSLSGALPSGRKLRKGQLALRTR